VENYPEKPFSDGMMKKKLNTTFFVSEHLLSNGENSIFQKKFSDHFPTFPENFPKKKSHLIYYMEFYVEWLISFWKIHSGKWCKKSRKILQKEFSGQNFVFLRDSSFLTLDHVVENAKLHQMAYFDFQNFHRKMENCGKQKTCKEFSGQKSLMECDSSVTMYGTIVADIQAYNIAKHCLGFLTPGNREN
jgi:hypothetical protein